MFPTFIFFALMSNIRRTPNSEFPLEVGGGGNALTFCKAVIETQRWSLMKNNGDRKGNLVLSIFASRIY